MPGRTQYEAAEQRRQRRSKRATNWQIAGWLTLIVVSFIFWTCLLVAFAK